MQRSLVVIGFILSFLFGSTVSAYVFAKQAERHAVETAKSLARIKQTIDENQRKYDELQKLAEACTLPTPVLTYVGPSCRYGNKKFPIRSDNGCYLEDAMH